MDNLFTEGIIAIKDLQKIFAKHHPYQKQLLFQTCHKAELVPEHYVNPTCMERYVRVDGGIHMNANSLSYFIFQ